MESWDLTPQLLTEMNSIVRDIFALARYICSPMQ
jgi:hypothetical protein